MRSLWVPQWFPGAILNIISDGPLCFRGGVGQYLKEISVQQKLTKKIIVQGESFGENQVLSTTLTLIVVKLSH